MPSSSGGSCQCLPTNTTIITPFGTCYTCPTNKYTAGYAQNGSCVCLNNFIWDSSRTICACSAGNTVLLPNGSCFICGTNGTNTQGSRANSFTCKCSSALLTWNRYLGICDCGSRSIVVIKNNAISCLSCST